MPLISKPVGYRKLAMSVFSAKLPLFNIAIQKEKKAEMRATAPPERKDNILKPHETKVVPITTYFMTSRVP